MSIDKDHSDRFEAYLKGHMSPEEAHAFERDHLDDLFTQESLEGFEAQGIHHLAELAALRKQIAKPKVRHTNRWRAMGIAALLIMGCVFVFLSIELSTDSPQLSSKEAPEAEQVDPMSQQDSISSTLRELEVAEQRPIEEDSGTRVEHTEPPLLAENRSEEAVLDPTSESTPPGGASIGQVETPESELAQTPTARSDFAAKSQIAEAPPADEGPVVAARIQEEVMEEVEDTEEQPIRAAPSRVSKKSQAFNGAMARSMAADISVGDSMVIETDTGMNTLAAVVDDVEFKNFIEPTNVSASPEGGIAAFNTYLSDSIAYPQAALDNGIEGTVLLELTIDAVGALEMIEVRQSLGYGCDEEAIRLVKSGPNWIPARRNGSRVEDIVEVKVNFRQ